MAIIKSVKEIEPLIPKRNEKAFMHMITHTSEKALHSTIVYGVNVENRTDKIEGIYRLSFSLFSSPETSYLFINKVDKEPSSGTPFIKAKTKEGETPKIEDWGFQNDEIGLFATVGLFDTKRIYFVTSHLDLKEIKDKLKNRKEEKILVAETVYV